MWNCIAGLPTSYNMEMSQKIAITIAFSSKEWSDESAARRCNFQDSTCMYNSAVYFLNSVKHHSSCSGTLLASPFLQFTRFKSHSEFGTHLGVHTGFLSTNLLRENVRFLGFLFDDDGLPRLPKSPLLGSTLVFFGVLWR